MFLSGDMSIVRAGPARTGDDWRGRGVGRVLFIAQYIVTNVYRFSINARGLARTGNASRGPGRAKRDLFRSEMDRSMNPVTAMTKSVSGNKRDRPVAKNADLGA